MSGRATHERACSAARRKRYHVASGIRIACWGSHITHVYTMAAKPPVCSRRSVARRPCSSRDHGFSVALLCRPAACATAKRGNPIPAAAADSGDKQSFTSTHAQALPRRVIPANVDSAKKSCRSRTRR